MAKGEVQQLAQVLEQSDKDRYTPEQQHILDKLGKHNRESGDRHFYMVILNQIDEWDQELEVER